MDAPIEAGFSEQNWKNRIQSIGQTAKQWLNARDGIPFMAYTTVAGITVWPIVEAALKAGTTGGGLLSASYFSVLAVGASIGGNLIAENLQRWVDKAQKGEPVDEETVTAWVAETIERDPNGKEILDHLIEHFDTIAASKIGFESAELDQFLAQLKEEMLALGNYARFAETISDSVVASEDGAKAAGAGANMIDGSLTHANVIVGDNNVIQLGSPEAARSSGTDQAPERDSSDLWPASYLRDLLYRCSHINMATIDPRAKQHNTARLALQAVFTQIDVAAPYQDRPELQEIGAKLAHGRFGRRLLASEARPAEPALTAISRPEHQQLVVIGDPGGGKSTLVRFIALCLAGELLQSHPNPPDIGLDALREGGWQNGPLLPLRVILRKYAARGLGAGRSIWEFIGDEMRRAELTSCVAPLEVALQQDGGLLLLDGLDEVPESNRRRDALREAIIRFQRDFPQVRIVVTTRPYAYQSPEWKLPGFEEVTLLDFNEEQIETYVDLWYAEAGAIDPDLGSERAAQFATQLKREIGYGKNLRELAERPLLLALMVSIHRWRGGGALPERRVELYDEGVNLLLDLWQRPKIIYDERGEISGEERSALSELGLSQKELRLALARVAYLVHKDQPEAKGTADIKEGDLIGILYDAIPESKRSKISVDDVKRYVRDRAGLIVDQGSKVYSFPHRTFQEYLAAWYLKEDDESLEEEFPDNLVSLARQDPLRWREAVLLAGSDVHPSSRWDLIKQLYDPQDRRLGPDDATSTADWWGAFLAGQLLWDNDLVTEANRKKASRKNSLAELQHWHIALVQGNHLPPRDRALAGRLLNRLGDDRPGIATLDEMRFAPIPAGRFWLGNDQSGEGDAFDLSYAYWLALYPLTTAQWVEFVERSGFKPSGSGSLRGDKNRPAVWLNWFDGVALCRWLTERWAEWLPEGYVVTLPNEAEWEKGARGGLTVPQPDRLRSLTPARFKQSGTYEAADLVDNRLPRRAYPWGADALLADKSHPANSEQSGIGTTCAVGSFPDGHSPYGLHEMSGQVWEWTRTKWMDQYPIPPDVVNETMDSRTDGEQRMVLRGGAYYRNENVCSVRYRLRADVDFNDYDQGVRLCVSPASHSF
ncbi:MAG: SUMF1/EgtB/PvdO family nonheme iron enzyme [Chloroflexota bacterium]